MQAHPLQVVPSRQVPQVVPSRQVLQVVPSRQVLQVVPSRQVPQVVPSRQGLIVVHLLLAVPAARHQEEAEV